MPRGRLISSSLPNLVNGVSQQPVTLRLASQAELQENCLSTVSNGLLKRPGSLHKKKLTGTVITNAFCHTINRDEVEQYIVMITDGDLKVYDLDGTEKTVNFPDGKTYLTATDPKNDFSVTTIQDYTFIANKTTTVAQSSTSHASRDPEAVIAVRAGNYGKTYEIKKDGVQKAKVDTLDGSSATHSPWIDTTAIAVALCTGAYNGGTVTPNLTSTSTSFTRLQNLIYHTDATDFSIECGDGANGNAMDVVKDEVQRFSDLPKGGVVDGFTIKVSADKTTDEDDYYVKWVPNGTDSTNGVWKETVKPGEKEGLDASTMPHILVRESSGDFTFQRATWDNRLVGDLTTNPDPSFVGQKINNIFFARNRLAVTSQDSTVYSESSGFFNFFRTSVQILLDADPIDVATSHTKASNLFAAIPFNKKLILFSALTQFVLESNGLLTAKSVSIDPTTEFVCNPGTIPVVMGKNIYFTTPRGAYSGIMEYFTDSAGDTSLEDGSEMTAHVQEYVPSDIFKIAPASNDNTLALFSRATGENSNVYIWRTYTINQERLQNSWSKWVFESTDTILYGEFVNSELYLVISRADGTHLEVIDISLGAKETLDPYGIRLDSRVPITSFDMTYAAGVTSVTVPYTADNGTYVAVVDNDLSNTNPAGTILPCTWNAGTGKLEITGDYSLESLVIGRKYTSRYIPSTIMYRRGTSTGAQKADTQGRLNLNKIGINYDATGYFKVFVRPKGRPSYEYTFTGKILGQSSSTLGAVSLDDGTYSVPIKCRNIDVEIEIQSDSPLPMALLSIDWEGLYVKRSQGV